MEAFDLTAALGVMKRWPEGKKIAGLLRAVMSARSARIDLKQALRCVELVRQTDRPYGATSGAQPADEGLVAGALLNNAIIRYVRSTKSSSAFRSEIQIVPHLDATRKALHDDLCKVRDEALAHFGPGPTGRPPWADDKLMLVFDGATFEERSFWTRANYYAWTVAALHELIPTAIDLTNSIEAKKKAALFEELSKLPNLIEKLRDFQFDPADLFAGNAEEIATFWAGETSTNTSRYHVEDTTRAGRTGVEDNGYG